MNTKKLLLGWMILTVVLVVAGCSSASTPAATQEPTIGPALARDAVDAQGNVSETAVGNANMPNPASVYCEEQGGVGEFASGGGAANTAVALRSLLDSGQLPPPGGGLDGATIPLLPSFNAGQLLRTQVAFVNFQNGQGVRFLTEYAQYYAPINNTDLFYTFQGLTNDGQYYVAAILPVAHPSLPADAAQIPGGDPDAFANNYETYANDMALQIAAYGATEFTPSLALLDALIASLQVTP